LAIYVVAGGLLFAPAALTAMDVPAASQGDIRFYVDHAGFRGQEGKTYQEIYLMIYADQLPFHEKEGMKQTTFSVKAALRNIDTGEVSDFSWTTTASLPEEVAELKHLAVHDVWARELIPGNYRISVEVVDAGNRSGQVEFTFEVPTWPASGLSASQIEFVSRAEAGKGSPHFVKGDRTVIPHPARRYGLLNPTLFIYYEIYGLSDVTGDMTVTYALVDKDSATVKTYPEMAIAKPGASASVLHGLDVSTIPSGIYSLVVTILDSSGEVVKAARDLEVIQMDYVGLQPALTPEEAEIAHQQIQHIATSAEKKLYAELTLQGKAQFLIQFWRDRDPTPESLENEYLQAIQNRYHYANEQFSWGETQGWKTDRGRVLIQNGMPDEIQHHANEAASVPYEIWIYRMDRTYQFVFADLHTNGNLALLHSNKEDEVHNVHWPELIRRL